MYIYIYIWYTFLRKIIFFNSDYVIGTKTNALLSTTNSIGFLNLQYSCLHKKFVVNLHNFQITWHRKISISLGAIPIEIFCSNKNNTLQYHVFSCEISALSDLEILIRVFYLNFQKKIAKFENCSLRLRYIWITIPLAEIAVVIKHEKFAIYNRITSKHFKSVFVDLWLRTSCEYQISIRTSRKLL